MPLRALLRPTRRLLGYFETWHNDDAKHRLQDYSLAHVPNRQLYIDRGLRPVAVKKLVVNTDGSCDIRRFELWPSDGPEIVLAPYDQHSRHRELQHRRAVLSGISVGKIETL
eukprot:TRINITY_DN130_c1_g2_i1.p1 TRINITY_DN130_c1_g2~~TRINITY_DN130_c1_g2_i1.p1  ORF type:complete len:112 (+),score=36.12 TRINITY_DN130_c1_g2_i1:70-405(+)